MRGASCVKLFSRLPVAALSPSHRAVSTAAPPGRRDRARSVASIRRTSKCDQRGGFEQRVQLRPRRAIGPRSFRPTRKPAYMDGQGRPAPLQCWPPRWRDGQLPAPAWLRLPLPFQRPLEQAPQHRRGHVRLIKAPVRALVPPPDSQHHQQPLIVIDLIDDSKPADPDAPHHSESCQLHAPYGTRVVGQVTERRPNLPGVCRCKSSNLTLRGRR